MRITALILLSVGCFAQDRATRLNTREEERRSDRARKAQRKLDHELSSFLDWCKTRSMLLTMNARGEYVCVAPPAEKPKTDPPKEAPKPDTK